jgi:hypothetical protein
LRSQRTSVTTSYTKEVKEQPMWPREGTLIIPVNWAENRKWKKSKSWTALYVTLSSVELVNKSLRQTFKYFWKLYLTWVTLHLPIWWI